MEMQNNVSDAAVVQEINSRQSSPKGLDPWRRGNSRSSHNQPQETYLCTVDAGLILMGLSSIIRMGVGGGWEYQ